MKARILIVLTMACAVQLFARKSPVPVADSFYVVPLSSPTVLFESKWIGKLTPKDSVNWFFHPTKAIEMKSFGYRAQRLSATPADMFGDCVYFFPATSQHNHKADHVFFNSYSFLCPILDNVKCTPHTLVPASIRFYLDTAHLVTNIDNYLVSDTFPQSIVEDYIRPFYFRKYEVTNREYREFINYVLDSIARTRKGWLLPTGHLDKKQKCDLYTDSVLVKEFMLPENQRFYTRKRIDTRKIVYHFQQKPVGCPSADIEIYPDSLRWTKDFMYSYNDPMEAMYHWHPAYYEYPVVGLNYWQCLAFLEWKSGEISKSLKGKFNVLCALPSEIEWDYVSTVQSAEGQIDLTAAYYLGTCDDSWLTDLMLSRDSMVTHSIFDPSAFKEVPSKGMDQIYLAPGPDRNPKAPLRTYDDHLSNPIRTTRLNYEKTWGDFIYDGAFHTAPVKMFRKGISLGKEYTNNERSQAHFDEATGICWLDGNVSEWMREDLDENWRGIFAKHMLVLDGPYANEAKQVRDYENHYYKQLPKQGKLVRGCNWYDERFAMKYGKNVAGTQAKIFCDPDKAHCTLGFRYVIYLSEK